MNPLRFALFVALFSLMLAVVLSILVSVGLKYLPQYMTAGAVMFGRRLLRVSAGQRQKSRCGRRTPPDEEGNRKKHEEDKEQDFCDDGGDALNAPKAEGAGDNGDQEKC